MASLILNISGILFGALIIFILAELILKKTINLAKHWGWSGTFIGLTILSVGTSLPELITDIIASIKIIENQELYGTLSHLVMGTNVGSDIFQQNFILPIIAIVGVLVVTKKELFKQMGGLIFATSLLWIFSWNGIISQFEGFILVLSYIAYLFIIKDKNKSKAKKHLENWSVFSHSFIILVSFIVMALVTEFILNISQDIIQQTNISASLFGILFLGIIAALPELSTSLIAVLKHKKEISASVLIGSNITNPLFALGIGSMISSYSVPSVVLNFDLPVKLFTALLISYFLFIKGRLNKNKAILLISIYITYLILRFNLFPIDII